MCRTRFAALEKAGVAEKLAASTDLAAVQPFDDQEIRAAIEELNRSTEAISKQTETLRQQDDALSRLVNGDKKNVEAHAQLEARQTLRSEADRRSQTIAVSIILRFLVGSWAATIMAFVLNLANLG